MSLWLAIPAFIVIVIGLVAVPLLILEEIAAHLRHWRDDYH